MWHLSTQHAAVYKIAVYRLVSLILPIEHTIQSKVLISDGHLELHSVYEWKFIFDDGSLTSRWSFQASHASICFLTGSQLFSASVSSKIRRCPTFCPTSQQHIEYSKRIWWSEITPSASKIHTRGSFKVKWLTMGKTDATRIKLFYKLLVTHQGPIKTIIKQ